MAREVGLISGLSANFEVEYGSSLDARHLCETKADLIAANTWKNYEGESYTYVGMFTLVYGDTTPENNGFYWLKALPITEEANWVQISGNAQSGTLDYLELINKPSINGTTLTGNLTSADLGFEFIGIQPVDTLPALTEAKQNIMYLVPNATDPNTRDEWIAIEDPESTTDPKELKWEQIGSTFIDLTVYVKTEDITFKDTMATTDTAGALSNGTSVLDKNVFEVAHMMLFSEKFPELTDPTITITAPAVEAVVELNTVYNAAGATDAPLFVSAFDQGMIEPQFTATSDKRAGLPNKYVYNDSAVGTDVDVISTALTDGAFTSAITFGALGARTFTAKVAYDAGVQPKSNYDNDFETPYPAGETAAASLVVDVVNPIFATTDATRTMIKQPLVATGTEFIELNLISEDGSGFKQGIMYGRERGNITKIEQLNTLSGEFITIPMTTFTVTDDNTIMVGPDGGQTAQAYKVVTHNGSNIGKRTMRFYFDNVIPIPIPSSYLTFKGDAPFTLKNNNQTKNWDGKLEYSTDTETWSEFTGTEIDSSADGNLYLAGTGNSVITGNHSRQFVFTGATSIQALGNIETLLDYDTVTKGEHPVMKTSCYKGMFDGCASLTKVPELPTTALTQGCYDSIFRGCVSLTAAPELPATTLSYNCYQNMFTNCTSLTVPPVLPATTLAESCYRDMFSGCTSLVASPELSATTLATHCYNGMLEGCTSLATAPVLPATNLATYCYRNMLAGCTLLTTPPVLPATTLNSYCYNGMLSGCTSLTTAPELPATVLGEGCYGNMFNGCTGVKVSQVQVDGYQTLWTIPSGGSIETAQSGWNINMLLGTGGTFTGDPQINTTYYLFDPNFVEGALNFKGDAPFTLKNNNQAKNWDGTLEYSTDGTTWSEFTGTEVSSADNGILSLRGTGNSVITGGNNARFVFTGATSIDAIGNIETLLDHEAVSVGEHPIMANNCYYYMFANCTSLTTAPELPANNLTWSCYNGMFASCTSLITAPELPANNLTWSCYQDMFKNCTSLVTPPELSATNLSDNCYNSMFSGCTSLRIAPVLLETTLAYGCYNSMFSGCTSLISAPDLTAEILLSDCYNSMFAGCTSLEYSPLISATVSADSCCRDMFNGCVALIEAPELLATQLDTNCYSGMFSGCSSLRNPPALDATNLAPNCYKEMFDSCRSLKYAPDLPAFYLPENCYSGMFRGCYALSTPPVLYGTDLAPECCAGMFSDCRSLIVAPALPATTLNSGCYLGMFSNCELLTNSPELSATSLMSRCYDSMFEGCTSLATAPALPATALADYCYSRMFSGCISLTTPPELPATTLVEGCYYGMFDDCILLRVSGTQTAESPNAWRIPSEGIIVDEANGWNEYMLYGTGGTFTGAPQINTTYYVS